MKLYNKRKQKSKSKSEESQLPSNLRGCNENTRFQGQLRFPGKLGMCPSLAEPDSSDFSKTNRRQTKSFSVQQFFKNAAEVWASSPHLRSKLFLRWLQTMSHRQMKSFLIQQFFKNVGEVWASSPHLRSKLFLQSIFPAAIAFFETV